MVKRHADDEMLHHVGCGRPMVPARDANSGTFAMACGGCDAVSPILVRASVLYSARPLPATVVWEFTPASLALAIGRRVRGEPMWKHDPPHIEAYLGFSDYQHPLKAEISEVLRGLGLTSMSECPAEPCVRQIQARRARLARERELARG